MGEGLNKVMLLGNLGADAELRVTPGGQSIMKLRIATTESYVDKSNTRQERTEWSSVTMFGKRAEALSAFLKKGDRIFVEGSLRTSEYEKDGDRRFRTEVIAYNIILAGGGRRESGDSGDHAPQKAGRGHGGATRGRTDVPLDAGGGGGFDPGYDGGDDEIPFILDRDTSIGRHDRRALRWTKW